MSDVLAAIDTSGQKIHLTDKAKTLYELFCKARAETRATTEGAANAAEFFDVGKEQGDKVVEMIKEKEAGQTK
jgi:hypothetical protein